MDEPTNDLDLETLEMLEEKLVDYEGTLLLVSHDRAFLDNVVTSVFVFEGEGTINEYIGGYAEWFALSEQRKKQQVDNKPIEQTKKQKPKSSSKRISFKQQKELEQLPGQIDSFELEQEKLADKIGDANFYKQEQDIINETLGLLKEVEQKLEQAYQQWDELEAMLD